MYWFNIHYENILDDIVFGNDYDELNKNINQLSQKILYFWG